MLYLMSERVEELWLIHKAINNVLIFSFPFKCAKHSVPNNQNTSVVLVQAVPIGTMMNSVVLSCVEYIF